MEALLEERKSDFTQHFCFRDQVAAQRSQAELPAALNSALMVSRSGLQHAAVASYAYKLQCLKSQVWQISRERDKARLDLEKAERHCLQLSRELDKQYIALKHSQSKLKDVQTEMEAKELLLQQAINHQVKLQADAQFLQGKEATLRGRLNLMMKENTQLQNKVMEMGEKLTASEKLVLELQKELSLVVKDKLDQEEPHKPELLNHGKYFAEIVLEYERQCQRVKVLWDQNDMLQRELEELRLQLQEGRAERGLLAGEMSITTQPLQEQLQDLKVQLETKVNYNEEELELMRKNLKREKDSKESFKAEMSKVEDKKEDPKETVAKYQAVTDVMKEQKPVQSLGLEERSEMELVRIELQHTKDIGHPRQQLNQEGGELRTQCRNRGSLRKHMSKLSREREEELKKSSGKSKLEGSQPNTKLFEAKASLSLAQTQHALQLQQVKAQLNNVVPRKQFEQLQASLREEQCRVQQLQANLQQQAEQACRQLVRTQEEHERLLQAAVEQAEGLQCDLRSAEAVLADGAARLKDAQAQLSRNKLLIKDLREENRGFAMALQAAELKQMSIEKKNHMLEEQALALKKLIEKITPASLSA
ncbi:ninein-like protein isoform X7 [Gallus gallus]|uniref:ninein-like protein isoform X7 n=1 Tax=Gallus gallus TaxID=9031 RepID=UPI001AE6828D|nr:ninein-like protein isoform X7 [Gallus gallus]XP_040524015.1 ninein-like protein isoform X7 [Gallus gallus]